MLETGGLQGFVAAILVCRLVREPVLVEQDEEWLNQLPNILFFSGLHECTHHSQTHIHMYSPLLSHFLLGQGLSVVLARTPCVDQSGLKLRDPPQSF